MRRKTPQKTNPIFRAQKIWTCYDSLQITVFWYLFFLPIGIVQTLENFWNCNVTKPWEFARFSVFHNKWLFYKVMQLHARKTVRRVVYASYPSMNKHPIPTGIKPKNAKINAKKFSPKQVQMTWSNPVFLCMCVCHYFYTEHCIMYNRGHHALHFLFTIYSSEFTWIVFIVPIFKIPITNTCRRVQRQILYIFFVLI